MGETLKYRRADGSVEHHAFRGETGAQDTLVPSVDNFLQLQYPRNMLTEYLFQLRPYRPKQHREYLEWVGNESMRLGAKGFFLKDPACSVALLRNLNSLRMMRGKHWSLVKKYILDHYEHPVGTGGTPVTTWLPNNLGATMEYMNVVVNNIEALKSQGHTLSPHDEEAFDSISLELSDHVQRCREEVEALQLRPFEAQAAEEFGKRSAMEQGERHRQELKHLPHEALNLNKQLGPDLSAVCKKDKLSTDPAPGLESDCTRNGHLLNGYRNERGARAIGAGL